MRIVVVAARKRMNEVEGIDNVQEKREVEGQQDIPSAIMSKVKLFKSKKKINLKKN